MQWIYKPGARVGINIINVYLPTSGIVSKSCIISEYWSRSKFNLIIIGNESLETFWKFIFTFSIEHQKKEISRRMMQLRWAEFRKFDALSKLSENSPFKPICPGHLDIHTRLCKLQKNCAIALCFIIKLQDRFLNTKTNNSYFERSLSCLRKIDRGNAH